MRVSIEHGHANRRSDDYSSTAYWYQEEPHKPFDILPVEERLPRADFPDLKPDPRDEIMHLLRERFSDEEIARFLASAFQTRRLHAS